MKKLLALALTLALTLSVAPASAARADKFPAAKPAPHAAVAAGHGNGNGHGNGRGFQHKYQYRQYADISGSWLWCEPYARSCTETGLMQGNGNGFAPAQTMTRCELFAIAARLSETLSDKEIAMPAATDPWYQGYLDYLAAAGVTGLENPTQNATRGDFVALLAQVVPDENLTAINKITALPDSADATVLKFYNAGILTGGDEYGTFHAAQALSRAEGAAMVARLTDPELRKTFVPKEKPAKSETPGIALAVLGVDPQTTILTVGSANVAAEDYLLTLLRHVLDEENAQLSRTGLGLDWNASYDVGDLNDYFKQLATNTVVADLFSAAKCEQLHCTPEELVGKLSTKAGLDAFIKDSDILRAKHILIPTVDLNSSLPLPKEEAEKALTLANTILAKLQADPSEGNFDKLMKEFSKDVGLARSPNGYIFTKDEMVPPFENGTRALAVGQISGLVESSFGYHIILRLDPVLDTNVINRYQQNVLNEHLTAWIKTNEVRSTPLYNSLDVQSLFTKAMPLLQPANP